MIIVYGYSKLAAEVCMKFKQKGYVITIVEPSKKEHEFAIKDGYYDKIYDYACSDDNDLKLLGVSTKKIRTFFCLSNDFNKNLFVTLSVRNLDPNLQIIALARDENDATKLKLAGATATINPYETTAIKIFRLIHRPVALHILNDILYSDSDLIIKEVTVPHNSKLEDKMTKEIDILINIISF